MEIYSYANMNLLGASAAHLPNTSRHHCEEIQELGQALLAEGMQPLLLVSMDVDITTTFES